MLTSVLAMAEHTANLLLTETADLQLPDGVAAGAAATWSSRRSRAWSTAWSR